MPDDHEELFDRWSGDYDRSVNASVGIFPFDGYEQVLETITGRAAVRPGLSVLDVGTGTGNLAARFVTLGCEVWGSDFSGDMLARAREKLPQAHFVRADLCAGWPPDLPPRFDRIVSAYVFHEFDLEMKVRLLRELSAHLPPDGRLVIGDIAFETAQSRQQAHDRWRERWDEDEFYWAADESLPLLQAAGFQVEYVQVSFCGGVFLLSLAG